MEIDLKSNPRELLKQLAADRAAPRMSEDEVAKMLANPEIAQRLYEACRVASDDGTSCIGTLTGALNLMLDKSDERPGMNGFERMLAKLNIPVRNDMKNGTIAGIMDLFFSTPAGTALVPEFIVQTLRDVAEEQWDISGLVAERVFTPNGTFKQPYLDLSNLDTHVGVVGEGADLPEVSLKFTEFSKTIGKRGCIFRYSYESVRRMSIPLFQLALQRIAFSNVSDLVAALIEVLIAAVTPVAKSTYNGADANDSNAILYETFLNYTGANNGLRYSKVLGNLQTIIKVLTMGRPSVDPMLLNALTAQLAKGMTGQGVRVQNPQWGDVELIVHPSIADWTLVAIDPRFAALQITEAGADIVESGKIIRNQTNELAITMADDFVTFDTSAIRVMSNI